MRYLYSLILLCLLPLAFLRLFVLGWRTPAYRSGWGERLGFIPAPRGSRPVIWLHAVSVGEVEASVPLLQRLLADFDSYQVIVSTVTPTGAQTLLRRFPEGVGHRYFPYDVPAAVRRFLDTVRPRICIIMETELWPNLYYFCRQRGTPILLANARVSAHSFSGYRKVPGLVAMTLGCVSRVIAQSELDARRLVDLGCQASRITVAGNLKFDVPVDGGQMELAGSVCETAFAGRRVWIAASTHDGEEEMVLDAFQRILSNCGDCVLILAPRHPPRFDAVADLCRERGFTPARQSCSDVLAEDTRILLLDSLGVLKLYYSCADVAFVGGSLVAAGGHNVLEPAALGVPVVSGPHTDNFHEIVQILKTGNALILVADSRELADITGKLLDDPRRRAELAGRAKKLVAENRGGTEKTVGVVRALLAKRGAAA